MKFIVKSLVKASILMSLVIIHYGHAQELEFRIQSEKNHFGLMCSIQRDDLVYQASIGETNLIAEAVWYSPSGNFLPNTPGISYRESGEQKNYIDIPFQRPEGLEARLQIYGIENPNAHMLGRFSLAHRMFLEIEAAVKSDVEVANMPFFSDAVNRTFGAFFEFISTELNNDSSDMRQSIVQFFCEQEKMCASDKVANDIIYSISTHILTPEHAFDIQLWEGFRKKLSLFALQLHEALEEKDTELFSEYIENQTRISEIQKDISHILFDLKEPKVKPEDIDAQVIQNHLMYTIALRNDWMIKHMEELVQRVVNNDEQVKEIDFVLGHLHTRDFVEYWKQTETYKAMNIEPQITECN